MSISGVDATDESRGLPAPGRDGLTKLVGVTPETGLLLVLRSARPFQDPLRFRGHCPDCPVDVKTVLGIVKLLGRYQATADAEDMVREFVYAYAHVLTFKIMIAPHAKRIRSCVCRQGSRP